MSQTESREFYIEALQNAGHEKEFLKTLETSILGDMYYKELAKFITENVKEKNIMSKSKNVRILIKKVGKPPETIEVLNELKTLQKIVGGYIENVNLPCGVILVCNEEGKIHGLPPNFNIEMTTIVGDCFFTGFDKAGNFGDITEIQIDWVMKNIFGIYTE